MLDFIQQTLPLILIQCLVKYRLKYKYTAISIISQLFAFEQ